MRYYFHPIPPFYIPRTIANHHRLRHSLSPDKNKTPAAVNMLNLGRDKPGDIQVEYKSISQRQHTQLEIPRSFYLEIHLLSSTVLDTGAQNSHPFVRPDKGSQWGSPVGFIVPKTHTFLRENTGRGLWHSDKRKPRSGIWSTAVSSAAQNTTHSLPEGCSRFTTSATRGLTLPPSL